MQISAKLLVGLSLVATAATIANALLMHKQFFPSMLHITKSNASMAVIYFQAIMIVFMIFQLLKRIFFGELRAAETEHLSERAWHAVVETCLAFTVFRDDFSPTFVMQFVLLLFVKCFHWLADDRVDIMERSPLITLKFHMRMLSVIGTMAAVDAYLVSHAYFSIILKGTSSQLVFGFEYAILITMVFHVAIKYILHMHDLRTAQNWEAKTVYLLYAELVMNFARCMLYGLFALLMMRLHTFPLFSIRPFYLSVRALHKALNDVILSRRAIAAMNTMFPVVNEEELANIDSTCIICREEMTAESQPKRLPCSHVFHAHCLRSWFQRQQTCPTCRTDILANRANNREQAPAAPPQQQQAGPIPFMPFAHQFAFHHAHQVNAANNEGAQNAQENNGQQAPPEMNGFANLPGFFQPIPGFQLPFGFMPPVPPPLPPIQLPDPPTLNGLSDEELRRLEGDTREAIINRLRALRDISTLLDAADIMMTQYMTTLSLSVQPEVPAASQNGAVDLSQSEPSSNGQEAGTSSNTRSEEEQPSTSSSSMFGSSKPATVVPDPSEAIQEGEEATESADEIRQRRLRRFAGETDA